MPTFSKIRYCINHSYSTIYYKSCFEPGRVDRWFRTKGPAFINKKIKLYRWFKEDKFHRIDGPSDICLTNYKLFYFNDIRYKEEEYWNQ